MHAIKKWGGVVPWTSQRNQIRVEDKVEAMRAIRYTVQDTKRRKHAIRKLKDTNASVAIRIKKKQVGKRFHNV